MGRIMNWQSDRLHLLWGFLIIFTLVISGMFLMGIQTDWADMLYEMRGKPWIILTTGLIYALCLAVPFVPGVEIGILLMVIFGQSGILMAYLATIVGLTVAFSVGLYLRSHFVDNRALVIWRNKAREYQQEADNRLSSFRLGMWIQAHVDRKKSLYPYLMTGVLFNVPGNWLIGGGGGIALMAGLSGQLRWLPFVLTVMLATSAVPLLAWFGLIELERWLPVFSQVQTQISPV